MYRLRVTLEGFKPPIWRQLLISPDASFYDLHSLIQDAFEWEDDHLHSFRAQRNKGKKRIYIQDEELNEDYRPAFEFANMPEAMQLVQDEFFNEETTKLSEFLNEEFPSLKYDYDFGDNWSHIIKLERLVTRDSVKPVILDGERSAPPEDSRAWVDGAEDILQASQNKQSDYWRRLVEDWGEETAEDFAEMSKIFLEPVDLGHIKITKSSRKRR